MEQYMSQKFDIKMYINKFLGYIEINNDRYTSINCVCIITHTHTHTLPISLIKYIKIHYINVYTYACAYMYICIYRCIITKKLN